VLETRYRVLFGACLTQFVVIGMLFSYGLFFNPLEAEFGWSRTFLSSVASLAFFMMGVLAILAGRMNDLYGPRLVLGISGVAYGAGFVLLSQVTAQWQVLVIFGVFVALGLGAHDVVTLSTIARWFPKSRGTMSGIVKTGTALGQIALPPLAAFLLLNVGWRQTLIILGLGALCLGMVAAFSMARPPGSGQDGTPVPQSGQSFGQAQRSRAFWSLCAIQFLFFSSLLTVPTHLAVHGTDLGMTTQTAAILLSVLGAASIAGRLTVGAIADRIGSKRALLVCFTVLLGSLLGFIIVHDHTHLFVVVAFYGFSHGGLFTVVSPLVAEYFGMKSHGAIFGTILFCGTVGGAIGPILAGRIFDVQGSYQLAFVILALLTAAGFILAATLPWPRSAIDA
jgi:MFS family permease